MTDQVMVVQNEQPLTVGEIQTHVGIISKVLKEVMIKDTHYGTIPGCGNKPTLLKPGAEKIAATFRLAVDPLVEDLSKTDEIRYRITVRLVSPSGVFVGAGLGECSSNEDKYKWRKAACIEEYEQADEERRRMKWGKGYGGKKPYSVKQIRTEPADVANTVLKMAKKRAFIDAVLTVTGTSDIFAQDLEDLPDEIRNELAGREKERTSKPSEPKTLPPYPAENFQDSFDKWAAMVQAGKKTKQAIIATISSRYVLTEEQVASINDIEGSQ